LLHDGESVNSSQTDIERKKHYIRTWKKHSFLDISSSNIDTVVPSLCQCGETRSMEVFRLLSQPLPHLPLNLFVISETFATFLDPVVSRFTLQTLPTVNRKHIFMNIICIESFRAQNTHNRMLLFGSTTLKHVRHFDYYNKPLNLRMRVCYLDCNEAGLCCYLVTHIKAITSITAV
jgi:hypothetical protein